MKKNAFTLMDLLLAMTILAVIAATMVINLSKANFDLGNKSSRAKVYKTLESIQQASNDIKEFEKTYCPMKKFIVETTKNNYEYVFTASNSTDVFNIYKNYLKFQGGILNFCSYTSNCSDTNIKGGKLPGDIYIGFEVNTGLINCPNYRVPEDATTLTGRGKCWGKLYIKVSDVYNKYDTLGKDYFVFGLNEDGVVY